MTEKTNFLTNILLTIIAGLLLVLVIQNGMNHPSHYLRPQLNSEAPHMAPMGEAPSRAAMGAEMIFSALVAFPEGCQGKRLLAECDSAAAQEVKSKILQLAEAGQGPRQIFDFVVNTYGEKVLIEEARQIRKNRKAAPAHP